MTNSLRIVLGLLAFSALGMAISGQPIYSRLSYFWLIVIIINWMWSRSVLIGLKINRSTNQKRGQIGQVFIERFELINTSRSPRLWLEIKDHSTLPGSPGSRVFVMPGRKQGQSYFGRTRLVKRGAYQLGPTSIRGGDPFGLFPVSKEFPTIENLLVIPYLVNIDSFPGPPGLLPGGESLRRRTHQITPNASNIRDYTTGDSFKRIHWKSSARRDKLMVKEFELDPLAEIWIFVDGHSPDHVSKPYSLNTKVEGIYSQKEEEFQLAPETEEYAATIAVSITRYYLKNGRSVGLAINSANREVLTPDKTGRQLDKILEAMALMKPDGEIPFSAMVTNQCRHMARGSTVVLITPSVKEELTIAVDQITRLGLRPIVVLIDAESFGGKPGTKKLAKEISHFAVPVGVISYQDDIGATLSTIGQLN